MESRFQSVQMCARIKNEDSKRDSQAIENRDIRIKLLEQHNFVQT